MKTVRLPHSFAALAVLFLATTAPASWVIMADGDARYNYVPPDGHDAMLHGIGASARKTFADNAGDRLILFGLVEAEHNFSDIMLHELYGRIKGPLGMWNLTLGRFALPYGLLYNFSASRQIYRTVHQSTLGFDADNGVMLSGTVDMLDYALSFTQGYGPHMTPGFPGHGLFIARTGFTFGESEDVTIGLSTAYGTTHGHEGKPPMRRMSGGIDGTVYIGRATTRFELNGGTMSDHRFVAAFGAVDYALLPRIDITAALTVTRHGGKNNEEWFAGVSWMPAWFTLRGGYRYAPDSPARHEVTLQLYRLFSLTL